MVYNLSRSQVSDIDESSQNLRLQGDMSTSKTGLSKCTQSKSSVEDIYDSGIHSGSNLSSGTISETDLKYGDSSSDCEYSSSGAQMKESFEGDRREESSSSCKLDVWRRADSGIDVDWSTEQYSYSKSAEASPRVLPEDDGHFYNSMYSSPFSYLFLPDEDGNTWLHEAILEGYKEDFIRNIIQNVPNLSYLDIQNDDRLTCLHLSVLLNQPKIARLLLLAGAKTGIEDRNGNTALHLACKLNFLECVEALLCPVNKFEQKFAAHKYKPVIDQPRQYINEYNYDGISCVHMAGVHPDLEVLRILIASGGDINIQECKGGYTVLHNAVISGNLDLLSYILQLSGIDLEKKNYARLTPYQLSVYHPRIGDILHDKGALRLITVDEESDEDYSSDEDDSEDDDDLYHNLQVDSCRVQQVTDLVHSLSTNDVKVPAL